MKTLWYAIPPCALQRVRYVIDHWQSPSAAVRGARPRRVEHNGDVWEASEEPFPRWPRRALSTGALEAKFVANCVYGGWSLDRASEALAALARCAPCRKSTLTCYAHSRSPRTVRRTSAASGRRLHQIVDQQTQRSRINLQRIDQSFDVRCPPDTEHRLGERTIFAAQFIVGERILRIAARDRGF